MLKSYFFVLVFCIMSFLLKGQSPNQIVEFYFEQNKIESMQKLNHGPLVIDVGSFNKVVLFFVESWDEVSEDYNNYGVIYNSETGVYTKFGNDINDYSYSDGVIAVFTENIDHYPDKEMIVISQIGNRTFYADGGYAGINVCYQTRVFKVKSEKTKTIINEYKTIGELLTVNQPGLMGTKVEEKLIGRDKSNINEIYGVTHNADAVKNRIRYFKSKGLLGSFEHSKN